MSLQIYVSPKMCCLVSEVAFLSLSIVKNLDENFLGPFFQEEAKLTSTWNHWTRSSVSTELGFISMWMILIYQLQDKWEMQVRLLDSKSRFRTNVIKIRVIVSDKLSNASVVPFLVVIVIILLPSHPCWTGFEIIFTY